jgi:hypothetical protein
LKQQKGEGLPALHNKRSLKLSQQQGEGLLALLNRWGLNLRQQQGEGLQLYIKKESKLKQQREKNSQLYLTEGVCYIWQKGSPPLELEG